MAKRRSPCRPEVVLVGRPNVGKSTLFNRICGSRRALVTAVPGTTRDVLSSPAEWQETTFTLVDTGGMFGVSTDPLHDRVIQKGRSALADATAAVLVVDAREGRTPGDEEIAKFLRTLNIPTILAANKTDDRRSVDRLPELYALGFDPSVAIAAEHGDGVAELLDEIVARLPRRQRSAAAAEADRDTPAETRVAIVGRPNVGKSSLVNRLMREERLLVSETPGTTRDTVDVELQWHRQRFRIVDTAGIRRRGRVARAAVEALSVVLARRAIRQADIAVILLDASEGATDQDAAIAGEAERAGCGLIVAVNKWDLVRNRGMTFVKEFDDKVRRQLKFLTYAPILHLSAATGEHTGRLLQRIERVARARHRRLTTGELNRFFRDVTRAHPPRSADGKAARILYAAQTAIAPPTFVLFVNVSSKLHFSYERFLVNQLRKAFGFEGTPVRLVARRRR